MHEKPKLFDGTRQNIHFEALAEFHQESSKHRGNIGTLWPSCVKSSFSKCYEFNRLVRDESKASEAFFFVPSLRGICEDIIVLGFLCKIPTTEREDLLHKLMLHDAEMRVETQASFFDELRPQQPILRPGSTPAINEEEIRAIWRAHGWPGMNRGVIPQTRQIAEKQGEAFLAYLYDYLYRLTSGTVHFSALSLLRLGWGEPDGEYQFSPRHFDRYFLGFSTIYGAMLFCMFFELFDEVLQPSEAVKIEVSAIRKSLFTETRWPEMVTFEEMNIKPPQIGPANIFASLVQAAEDRFLKPTS